MIVHALHNAISTLLPLVPRWPHWTGMSAESQHLPLRILAPAAFLFITGLLLLPRRPHEETDTDAASSAHPLPALPAPLSR